MGVAISARPKRYIAANRQACYDGAGLGLPLLPREADAVLAIMAGHTTAKDIGRHLCISPTTVNNYFYFIFRKTGAGNVADIVLMMTGVIPVAAALRPVQGRWRRAHYQVAPTPPAPQNPPFGGQGVD